MCMDVVLWVISVSAFVMSLASWVLSLIHQRRNLKIRIVHHCSFKNYFAFYVSFENSSRVPILISQIFLIADDGSKFECYFKPRNVYDLRKEINNIPEPREIIKSVKLPLALPALGGDSGYVAFSSQNIALPTLSTGVNFQVQTNRGGPIQLSLEPGPALDLQEVLRS